MKIIQRLLLKTNGNLRKVINELEEENTKLKEELENAEHNNLILLENSRDLRYRIKAVRNTEERTREYIMEYYDKQIENLENNLEFVVNNLSKAKKDKIGA